MKGFDVLVTDGREGREGGREGEVVVWRREDVLCCVVCVC